MDREAECWRRVDEGEGRVSFSSLFGSVDLSAVPRSLLSKTNAEPDGHLMCAAISCQSACGNKAGAVLLKTCPPSPWRNASMLMRPEEGADARLCPQRLRRRKWWRRCHFKGCQAGPVPERGDRDHVYVQREQHTHTAEFNLRGKLLNLHSKEMFPQHTRRQM